MWHPFCPTCTCSWIWEMVTHVLTQILWVYLGTMLTAITVIAWLLLTKTNL